MTSCQSAPLEAKAEFGLQSLPCLLLTTPSPHHVCQGLEAGCSHTNGGDSPSQSREKMGPGEFEMALSGCLSSLLEPGTRMPLASFAYANEGLEGEDHPGQH